MTTSPHIGIRVAALLLALLTVAVVLEPGPLPGERGVVSHLQRLGEPVPTIAAVVRSTTSTEACLLAGLLPAVWLLRRDRRRGAAAIAIALLAMLVVQPASKIAVDRPRPTVEQVDVRADHDSKSFPSGHSLSTTTTWGAAALVLWRSRRKTLAVVAGLPVALTGVSSSIQGVHWPSDAIAGTIVGGAAALAIAQTTFAPGCRAHASTS